MPRYCTSVGWQQLMDDLAGHTARAYRSCGWPQSQTGPCSGGAHPQLVRLRSVTRPFRDGVVSSQALMIGPHSGRFCALGHSRPDTYLVTPEWPLRRRLERVTALVPLLLTGVRHHPPGRTDKNLCRCFGAPACRVSPDHLIRPESAPCAAARSYPPHSQPRAPAARLRLPRYTSWARHELPSRCAVTIHSGESYSQV